MKKAATLLLCLLVVGLAATSCVSKKKIVYFQGAEEAYSQGQKILQQYEMKLKPADQILVKVTCSNPELLEVFAQDVTMGAGTGTANNISSANSSLGNVYGYTINNQGDVILPAIGKVHVEGYTTEQAAILVENKIKQAGLVTDPEVTVRLLNARVAVLGAVSHPGVVSLNSERNTILDVLAQCGDVDDTGLRYRIRLFREVNGQRIAYDLDLTHSDIFESPAYYVQQNDMIYVEPNKSKRVKSSPFYTSLAACSSILAIVTTAVSMAFLILNQRNK